MSWDKAYKELESQLGRKPFVYEVQKRMLEISLEAITVNDSLVFKLAS